MALDREHVEIFLEVHTGGVPKDVTDLALMIFNDPTASLREKLLAKVLVSVIKSFNELCNDLENGTVTIRAYEEGITINPPKKRP